MGAHLTRREDIDFAVLEGEYRAGQKTIRQLAEEYNTSHKSLCILARNNGWERDLQPAIKERTAALLRTVAVDTTKWHKEPQRGLRLSDYSPENTNTSEVIEAAAQNNATVIRRGQKRIARLQGIVENMFEELATQSMSADDMQHMAEFVAMVEGQMTEDKVSKHEVDKRVAAFKKLLGLDSRADIASKLATSLKTLIGLERQAHGIADNANGDADGNTQNKDVALTVNEAARRVAFVLLSASKKQERVINDKPSV